MLYLQEYSKGRANGSSSALCESHAIRGGQHFPTRPRMGFILCDDQPCIRPAIDPENAYLRHLGELAWPARKPGTEGYSQAIPQPCKMARIRAARAMCASNENRHFLASKGDTCAPPFSERECHRPDGCGQGVVRIGRPESRPVQSGPTCLIQGLGSCSTGRIMPSCAVLATRRPSRLKICPRVKPRDPPAQGLSVTWSSHSSARKGSWNQMA